MDDNESEFHFDYDAAIDRLMTVRKDMIDRFLKRARSTYSLEFLLLENVGFCAQASTDDGINFKISVNKGYLRDISGFLEERAKKNMSRFPIISRLDKNLFINRSIWWAYTCIFHHEFTHVVNGHLGLLREMKISSHMSIEESDAELTGSNAENRTRYLLECEADEGAGGFLTSDLVSLIEQCNALILHDYDRKRFILECISMAAFSIHGVFWSFQIDPRVKKEKRRYAFPLVRSHIASKKFIDATFDAIKRLREIRIRVDVSRAEIRSAYNIGRDIMDRSVERSGISIGYNPQDEISSFEENDRLAVHEMRVMLDRHRFDV